MSAPSTRKRVLFIGEAISLAHVVRPIELTRSLDRSQYEIHFACDATCRPLLNGADMSVHDLSGVSPETFFARISAGKPVYTMEELREYFRADLALIEWVKPDLVIGDFRLSLSTSCELAGVPYAALVNAHWSPYSTLRFPIPDMPMTRLLGKRLSGLVMPLVLPGAFRRLARPYNQLRRECILEPLGDLRDVYTRADWTLYPDVPGISPTAGLPANHRYIVPVMWEPDIEMPRWKRFMDSSRPKAYVTMGSSGESSLTAPIVEALLSLGSEVLITADPKLLPWSMGDGVFAAPMLPGLQAAAMCDIVICHGGSGTVYQALSQGKPVLGICSNPDQQLVMAGVLGAGAGRVMKSRFATTETIRREVPQLLEDAEVRRAAQLAAGEISRFDAGERFRLFVDEVLPDSSLPTLAPVSAPVLSAHQSGESA